MDETGFFTVPTKVGKVICLRGLKKVGQLSSAERGTMVTMALAVNAGGKSIPPFFIFPRVNMQTTFLDNASPGSAAVANGLGWMTQDDFVKYMRHFIRHSNASIANPVLLLIDNHCSHLSVQALDQARDNGVAILSFPPHCSHRMTPLDVSVYGAVKTFYSRQCTAWMRNNPGKVLEICHIAGLVSGSLDLALTIPTIKSGFEKSGICPFNPDIFTDVDFVHAGLSGENEAARSIEAELNEDQQRRIVINDNIDVAANEEVSTSEVSMSISRATSFSSVLEDIGPLQPATPQPKKRRGRKPMKSTVLTSPENITGLKEKREKRDAAILKKNEAKKRTKRQPQRRQVHRRWAHRKQSQQNEQKSNICLNRNQHRHHLHLRMMTFAPYA